jgi:hypothetical protein
MNKRLLTLTSRPPASIPGAHLAGFLGLAILVACSADPGAGTGSGASLGGGGTGGSTGSNVGVPGTGGASVAGGSGGRVGSGGQTGQSAQPGTGGQISVVGSGGGAATSGSGGSPEGSGGQSGGTGGDVGRGSGGTAAGGSGGNGNGSGTGGRASGGTQGSGGTQASGGMPGSGGVMGSGGITSTPCTLSGSPNPGSGSFTNYSFGQGTARAQEGNGYRTACGYFGTESGGASSDSVQNISNATYFAAIPGRSSSDFNSSGSCGACAQVSNGGKSVIVTVIDECPQNSNPPCASNPNGHLDLSVPAFNALGFSVGNPSGTTWKFVPCPVMGNVKVRLKTGNPNEIFIENEILPIKSVAMGGQAAVRQSYGAWHFSANIAVGATLDLVDSANRTLSVTVSSTGANQNQDTGRQFPTCQ